MPVIADARHAFRMIRQAPTFYSMVIGILALGVSATVSVFSLADGVLFRPLPYPDSERLVFVESYAPKPPFDSNGSLSYADYQQLRMQARSFEDIAATYRSGWSRVRLTGGDAPESVQGAFVTPNTFGMFGVSPQFGRVFTAEEEQRGERVVVLVRALASARFGSAAQALGKDIEIDGEKWRIIGVMPDDFRVPFLNTRLWAPLRSHREWNSKEEPFAEQRQRWDIMARLRTDTTLSAAQAEVVAIENRLKLELPEFHKDETRVVIMRQHFTHMARAAFGVLSGAAAFLMLIVCANVANLLLARGLLRGRELAIRTALGAGRGRLIAQVVVEGVVVSVVAGAIGSALSPFLLGVLKAAAPDETPRLQEVHVDMRALLFALLVSLLIGLCLGAITAWKSARRETRELLGSAGRGLSQSREQRRVKSIMVASEFALAMVLLTGAVLLVRSFVAVLSVDPGFRPEHVLTVGLGLPPGTSLPQSREFYRRAMERLAAAPGVQAVGGVGNLFFLDTNRTHSFRQVEGRPPEPLSSWKPLVWTQVNGSYFEAMGIPLLGGRFFNESDRPESPPVAIVNETLARRFWPGENPIGKRLKGMDPRGQNDDWVTVVGVVKDTRSGGLERAPYSQIYEALAQTKEQIGTLVIRTSGNPLQAASLARSVIREEIPGVLIPSVQTMEAVLNDQTSVRRFETWLIGVFSLIALALAALGVFAVMHYSVAARTHEIGVRMAVGAGSRDLLKLVVGDGAKLAALGIGCGTLAALWASEMLTSLLYQVGPTDPVSFLSAGTVLMLVAIAACYLPAHRATRVDPLIALRNE